MTTENERILQIISHYCESQADFARKLGEKTNTVGNWLKRGVSSKGYEKILKAFPGINKAWLLTGEGEMIKDTHIYNNKSMKKDSVQIFTTKLVPLTALGGSLTGVSNDRVMDYDCETIVSPIAGIDYAIPVYGDSMAPEYPSGSKVLVRKINPDLFIDWGHVFVLDTENGTILKQIECTENKENVLCKSLNPDPKFAPFEVKLSDVFGIYRVLLCLSPK